MRNTEKDVIAPIYLWDVTADGHGPDPKPAIERGSLGTLGNLLEKDGVIHWRRRFFSTGTSDSVTYPGIWCNYAKRSLRSWSDSNECRFSHQRDQLWSDYYCRVWQRLLFLCLTCPDLLGGFTMTKRLLFLTYSWIVARIIVKQPELRLRIIICLTNLRLTNYSNLFDQ